MREAWAILWLCRPLEKEATDENVKQNLRPLWFEFSLNLLNPSKCSNAQNDRFHHGCKSLALEGVAVPFLNQFWGDNGMEPGGCII